MPSADAAAAWGDIEVEEVAEQGDARWCEPVKLL